MAETGLIYTLIPKVMADVGAVAKTGRNEQQGYSFRGIDQFHQAVHPALIKHGVFCCPQVLKRLSEDRVMRTGTPAIRVSLKVAFKFYAPDGSFIEVVTWGEGIDTSDKSTSKAMSMAMKYAFIELFSIPTEDIDDADRTSPEAGAAGKGEIAPPLVLTRPPVVGKPVKVPEPIESESTPCFISVKQKSYLAKRFRESLRKDLEPQAEELRHAALVALARSQLFKSTFVDGDGNPTSEFIRVEEYSAIGNALVKAAKSL